METRPPRLDAGDVSRMLAHQVESLVRELLPRGKRHGAEWVHPSLAGSSDRSLSIHITGAKAGVWADFSSGECGDALDLVAMVLHQGDKKAALAWSRAWLGLGDGGPAASARRPPAAAVVEPDLDAQARSKAALTLFLAAQPSLAGTPVAFYFAARGIDLSELGRQPRSLRFHPALWNTESSRTWPALVAAIVNARGEMTAVHRTWLSQDTAGRWTKAPLQEPKMSLGTVLGGSIRLWRGASGRAMAQATDGETVVIGEGIETCLSVAIACPELRVIAAVSLANLARVALPPAIQHVILAADNDGDNAAAAATLQRAIDRFLSERRTVRVARSPVGKDFNDALATDAA